MASSWERLATVKVVSSGANGTTTVSPASTISTQQFSKKEFLHIVAHYTGKSADSNPELRFATDGSIITAQAYAGKKSTKGADPTTEISMDSIRFSNASYAASSDASGICVLRVSNKANKEIIGTYETVESTNDPAEVPHQIWGTFKFNENINGSASSQKQIQKVALFFDDSVTFDAGTTLTVWGTDDQGSTAKDKSSITNVPAGTRYEEVDTRKIFRRKVGNTTTTQAMTSNEWTMAGNQGAAHTHSIDSGKIKWISSTSGNGSGVAVGALGITLGSSWVARFNWTTSSSYSAGGNGYISIGISDDSTYTTSETTRSQGDDAVLFQWHVGNNSGDRHFRMYGWNGGSQTLGSTSGGNSIPWENSATMYFEMKYDGSTITCQRYTDSTYSTAHSVTTPTISVSGITGLTHIIFGGTDTGSAHGGFTLHLNEWKTQNGSSTWSESGWFEKGVAV